MKLLRARDSPEAPSACGLKLLVHAYRMKLLRARDSPEAPSACGLKLLVHPAILRLCVCPLHAPHEAAASTRFASGLWRCRAVAARDARVAAALLLLLLRLTLSASAPAGLQVSVFVLLY